MGVPPKLLLITVIMLLAMLALAKESDYGEVGMSACDIENLITAITYPRPGEELQAAFLRSELRELLNRESPGILQALDDDSNEMVLLTPSDSETDLSDDELYELIGGANVAAASAADKRNIGALARAGLLSRSIAEIKRSIATLAKNGQLPSREPDIEETEPEPNGPWKEAVGAKRNIGSIVRSGYRYAGKRNVAAMARSHQLPPASFYYGKRNLASLVRTGALPSPKRNIGAMARDWALPNQQNRDDKRNLGALRNSPVHGGLGGGRRKRDLIVDVDPALMAELAMAIDQQGNSVHGGNVQNVDKRYLANLVEPSWLQYDNGNGNGNDADADTDANVNAMDDEEDDQSDGGDVQTDSGFDKMYPPVDKRHIGSLVRAGWQPSSFHRPIRKERISFMRAGRAMSNLIDESYRPLERPRPRQIIGDDFKRCLNYCRPPPFYNLHMAGYRGRVRDGITTATRTPAGRRFNQHNDNIFAMPERRSAGVWRTPPRLTALHRGSRHPIAFN